MQIHPTLVHASYTLSLFKSVYRKSSYTFKKCRKHVSYTFSFVQQCLGKFPALFRIFQYLLESLLYFSSFSRMCYNIEIFGTHLKVFLGNKPALYGFTGAKTGST